MDALMEIRVQPELVEWSVSDSLEADLWPSFEFCNTSKDKGEIRLRLTPIQKWYYEKLLTIPTL